MSNYNNNNNNNTSPNNVTNEIILSSLRSLNHPRHDSVDGDDFFCHVETNKRVKIDSSHKQDSLSFYANLNDTSEPTPQDMARRNKFVKKRRQRTERHISAHAEHLLSQVVQIEAEVEAPHDQRGEFVAAINGRSTSRRTFLSARISKRHHLTVAAEIMDEFHELLNDDE